MEEGSVVWRRGPLYGGVYERRVRCMEEGYVVSRGPLYGGVVSMGSEGSIVWRGPLCGGICCMEGSHQSLNLKV